jgi:ribonuclease HII
LYDWFVRKSVKKIKYIIGIDEVGRGPLAGPVAVGAVAIDSAVYNSRLKKEFKGIRDSKKLSEKKREEWFKKIKLAQMRGDIKFSVSFTAPTIIDKKGIVFSIQSALNKSLLNLKIKTETARIFLDGGLRAPKEYKNQKTIIHGDDLVQIISIASVVAKVTRDSLMVRFAKKFPQYGFERHKGYGTKAHYSAIKKYGITKIHRRSFLKNI